jgi:hypothetical protein
VVSAIDKVALPNTIAHECKEENENNKFGSGKKTHARTRDNSARNTTRVIIQSFATERPAHHEDVIVFGYFATVPKQFQQIKELPVNVAAHGRGRIDRLHVGLFQQNLLDLRSKRTATKDKRGTLRYTQAIKKEEAQRTRRECCALWKFGFEMSKRGTRDLRVPFRTAVASHFPPTAHTAALVRATRPDPSKKLTKKMEIELEEIEA